MFEPEAVIIEWRRQMIAVGIKSPTTLDELESHLRDDLARQMRSGATPGEAFDAAVQRIGSADELKTEFKKVGGVKASATQVKRQLLTLAGIPDLYLDTTMNTSNPNIEPRWATYLRSAAILAPAAVLLFLLSVYVIPRLQYLCEKSSFNALPNWDNWIKQLYHLNVASVSFCKDNFLLLLPAVLIALGMLEWRSSKWPRYRRAVLVTGAFLLNIAVLLSMSVLFLTATIVASVLLDQVK